MGSIRCERPWLMSGDGAGYWLLLRWACVGRGSRFATLWARKMQCSWSSVHGSGGCFWQISYLRLRGTVISERSGWLVIVRASAFLVCVCVSCDAVTAGNRNAMNGTNIELCVHGPTMSIMFVLLSGTCQDMCEDDKTLARSLWVTSN